MNIIIKVFYLNNIRILVEKSINIDSDKSKITKKQTKELSNYNPPIS